MNYWYILIIHDKINLWKKKRKRGRPKGSTKPNKKSQSNFKLSIEEKIAVNTLLSAMRDKTPPPDIENIYCTSVRQEIFVKPPDTEVKELFVTIFDKNSRSTAVCKCPVIDTTKKYYIIDCDGDCKVNKKTLKIEHSYSYNTIVHSHAFLTCKQAFAVLLTNTYQNKIMLNLMAVQNLELNKCFFETIRDYGYVAALELAARYFKMDIFNLYCISSSDNNEQLSAS